MKLKIVKYIAILFIVGFALNFIGGIGLNIWGVSEQIELNEKHSNSEEGISEIMAGKRLREIYLPKIDSLVSVNPEMAIPYIDKVLTEYPKNSELIFYKGVAYNKMDSFTLAIESFKKSMAISGYENPRALGNIGWTYFKQNNFDDALEYLIKASNSDKDYFREIALFYELREDYPNAVEYYKIVLEDWENSNRRLSLFKEIRDLKKKISTLEKLSG